MSSSTNLFTRYLINKPLKYLLGLVVITLSTPSYAIDISENLNVNAFINQGYVNSPDNPFYGEKGGSFDFRDIILNTNWQLNDNIRLSAQVMNRTTGKIEKSENSLDFLLADINLVNGIDYSMGVRLGRNKIPFGLYNSSRDIPTTRPGVYVPQSVYFEEYRDLLLSNDGLNLYYTLFNNIGELELQAYAGSREVSDSAIDKYSTMSNASGDYDSKGLSVKFTPNIKHNLTFNFSLLDSVSKVNGTSSYGFSTLPTQINFKGIFKMASLQYSLQDWIFTTEYVIADTTSNIQISSIDIPDTKFQSEGYYVQAEWLFHPSLTVLVRYDDYVVDIKDRHGSSSATATTPAHHFFANGLTLGGRWFINSHFSLTTELSNRNGTAGLDTPKNYNLNSLKKEWNVFSTELTYQF